MNAESTSANIAVGPVADEIQPAKMSPPADVSVDDYDQALEYRAICSSAIASLVLGLLSGLALLDWWLALVPMAGLVLGFVALRKIRSQPREYTGGILAVIGIILCLALGTFGISRQYYTFITEVPEGYDRISYSELQPQPDERPDAPPPDAMALSGKKVFIKGYVYPGERTNGITEFLLVRDQGSCCFGGNPKVTDRIQVSLADPNGFAFSNGLFKVAGVFRVTPASRAIDAGGAVLYHLDEAVLR